MNDRLCMESQVWEALMEGVRIEDPGTVCNLSMRGFK